MRTPILLGLLVAAGAQAGDAADCYSAAVALARVERRLEDAQRAAAAASVASHRALAAAVELPPGMEEPRQADWAELEAIVLGEKPPPEPVEPSPEEEAVATQLKEASPLVLRQVTLAGNRVSEAMRQVVRAMRARPSLAARVEQLGGCPEAREHTRGRPFGGAFPGTVPGQRVAMAVGPDLVWSPALEGTYVSARPVDVTDLARVARRSPESMLETLQELEVPGLRGVEDPVPYRDAGQAAKLCRSLERPNREAERFPETWVLGPVLETEWPQLQGTPGLEAAGPLRRVRCRLSRD